MHLSLLDRSRTRYGEADSDALRHTVDRARRAERLGYDRFWVAEHHAVPGIASGSPPVLMAAVAAATDRIRVGSGGIMLPNHAPLIVAEQVAMLSALHPGRIDLGIGRTPGFTEPVRRALRSEGADDEEFGAALDELRAYLDGTAAVTVRPRIEQTVPIFVLATGAGLTVAGERRSPVVVDARSAGPRASREIERVAARTIAGDEDTVAERLDALVERTGADELLVTSSTWDLDALAESDTRLATVFSGVTGYRPGSSTTSADPPATEPEHVDGEAVTSATWSASARRTPR